MEYMSSHVQNFTIGVEEEYQIIDPTTRELSSDSRAILEEARKTLGDQVQPEIHLSQIEIATPVCQNLSEARRELIRLRREIIAAAGKRGKKIVASGSHPFSHWSKQSVTPEERYQSLERDYKQLVREQSIFGCHVHVGIEDRETGILVMNYMRPWLAALLALSANSPFWWGNDTGYASFRSEIWARWPLSGPPPHFASLADYHQLTQELIETGSVEEPTKIYWDMRLSERYKTIEVRVMDVSSSVDDAIMLAGLVRALVQTYYGRAAKGESAPIINDQLIRASQWHAGRHGIAGRLIDVCTHTQMPAKDLIGRLLETVRPALEDSGDWQEIAELTERTFEYGNGALRQRKAYERSGSIQGVVDYLIEETCHSTLG